MRTVVSSMSSTATAPAAQTRNRHLAAGALAAIAGGFLTVIMLGAAMVPGYDVHGAAISDLGVAPETALLFNATLVLVGVGNLVGGYALYRIHGSRWLLGGYVVAGVGAAGAGVFTLTNPTGLHGLFALLAFVFFNAEAIATGRHLRGPLRPVSMVLGLVGLAFVVAMAFADAGSGALFGPIGHGGIERMIVYPPMLWLLLAPGYLLGGGQLAGAGER